MLETIKNAATPNTFLHVLANADRTTADEFTAPWVRGWKLVDLQNRVRTPQRLIVAVSDAGEVLQLSGSIGNVERVSKSAPVLTGPAAAERAASCLELARVMARLSYQVDAPEQIRWLENPTETERSERGAIERRLTGMVRPPMAAQAAEGWNVTLFRMNNRDLERHQVMVGKDGSLIDSVQVLADEMPVVRSA